MMKDNTSAINKLIDRTQYLITNAFVSHDTLMVDDTFMVKCTACGSKGWTEDHIQHNKKCPVGHVVDAIKPLVAAKEYQLALKQRDTIAECKLIKCKKLKNCKNIHKGKLIAPCTGGVQK